MGKLLAARAARSKTSVPDGTKLVRVERLSEEGPLWISVPGHRALFPARMTASFRAQLPEDLQELVGRTAVALFDRATSEQPVLLDWVVDVTDTLRAPLPEAEERLELRCGKASIVLTQEGKVLIEGQYVSTRSSGINRLRGAVVKIN